MNVHSVIIAPPTPPKIPPKKLAILNAALTVFSRDGFHGSPVPPIAKEAGVGVGTIYRYFADKESLVNEVFRMAKDGLRQALFTNLDFSQPAEALFNQFWQRLIAFARAEPEAFRFLEIQNHLPYLDNASKAVEREVLLPIMTAISQLQQDGTITTPMAAEPLIALVWGGVVGMFKYEEAGYFKLDPADLDAAKQLLWAGITVRS